MTEQLITLQMGLTLYWLTLSLARKPLIRLLGSSGYYLMWLASPLWLIIGALPQLPVDYVTASYTVEVMHKMKLQANQWFDSLPWLTLIWVSGCILLTALLIGSHLHFRQAILRHATQRKDIEFAVPVYQSTKQAGPFLLGITKPVLVLPNDFDSAYDAHQQRLILAHESQHIHHKDHWINAFFSGLQILFWFNPIVWLSRHAFRFAQEAACDEQVLCGLDKNNRISYAHAMLKVSTQGVSSQFATLHYGEKTMMKQRLILLKNTFKQRNALAYGLIIFSLALTASVKAIQTDTGASDARPIVRVEPIYPNDAAKQNIQGEVILSFYVTANGATKDIKVVSSTPAKVFDQAAIDALSKWRYHPRAQGSQHQVALEFKLAPSAVKPRDIETIEVHNKG